MSARPPQQTLADIQAGEAARELSASALAGYEARAWISALLAAVSDAVLNRAVTRREILTAISQLGELPHGPARTR